MWAACIGQTKLEFEFSVGTRGILMREFASMEFTLVAIGIAAAVIYVLTYLTPA